MLMRSGDRGEGEEGGEREAGGPPERAGQHREEATTSSWLQESQEFSVSCQSFSLGESSVYTAF